MLRIVRREKYREVPLEAVAHAFGAAAHGIVRPYVDGARHVQIVVEPSQESAVAPAINDVVVAGIRCQVSTLAARRAFPIVVGDEPAARAGINADGGIVLLRAVDAIREGIVCGNAVKLRRGLIHVRGPCFAGIVADLGAAVVADDKPARVLRRDPEVVVVAVRCVLGLKRPPAIGGDVVGDVHHVNLLHLGTAMRV